MEEKLRAEEQQYKAKEEECKTKNEELTRMKATIIEKYTQLAEEKTRQRGKGTEYETKNKKTIQMLCCFSAVNNVMKETFPNYDEKKVNLFSETTNEYKIFSFQILCFENYKKDEPVTIELLPPEGIDCYLNRSTLRIDLNDESYTVSNQDRIGIVLPLAPYKWNISFKDNSISGTSFFLEFSKRKLNKKDSDQAINENANTRYCLGRMRALIESQHLEYEFKIGEDNSILEYARNHSINKPSPSCLVIFSKQVSFLMKGETNCFECSEITSGNDILPINEIDTKRIKEKWTIKDYIIVDEEMKSLEKESEEDAQNYNKLHKDYLGSEKALSTES